MYKYATLFFAFLFLTASVAISQVSQITASTTTYDDNAVPSVSVTVEPETDWVKESFEDFMKDTYKVNLKGTGLFSDKDVLSAEEETIGKISVNEINFYARIVKSGMSTQIDLFGGPGGAFFEAGSNEMQSMRSILSTYLSSRLINYYEEKLEEITDERQDLEKDIAGLQKDIKKNTEDIADMERKIIEKRSENETKQLEIEELSTMVEKTKGNFDEWQKKQKQMRSALRKFQ